MGLVENPNSSATNQLLDLAVIRICGSLQVTPSTFNGMQDVCSVNAKLDTILPEHPLPAGRPLGNHAVLNAGADKIFVCGWASPHGETVLCTPDPRAFWGPSKGMLLSQALLHSGSSGGAAVDHG